MTDFKNDQEIKYGWIPDLPDNRDFYYAAPIEVLKALPAMIDLRASCPPVVNQGSLGSCTANAAASAYQYGQIKQAISNFPMSRLFIYYNTRVALGTENYDSGASLRETVKTMDKLGSCSEEAWPYLISEFKKKPGDTCYEKAETNQVLQYRRLDNTSLIDLKSSLAEGYPFIFGFSVKESFRTIGSNGKMPIPSGNERIIGGHAVMAVGYNDEQQVFIIQNSWGTAWGDKGYFYMPYIFITDGDSADDFWTIELVEQGLKLA